MGSGGEDSDTASKSYNRGRPSARNTLRKHLQKKNKK